MHLLLTDRLACPRCGPEFGLILLSDRTEDRQVMEGRLGCANCRDTLPVSGGFGDLRAPPRGELPTGRAGGPTEIAEGETRRLAALLGVSQGPGTVALIGDLSRFAVSYAGLLPDIEVVGVDADLVGWPEVPRVSRLAAGPGLPFFSRALRGVAVDGTLGLHWIRESARVVARLGHVVVVPAPEGTEAALVGEGLSVLASEGGTVVAARG